jgi:uncharacterized protein YlxW (UPF0749 family)
MFKVRSWQVGIGIVAMVLSMIIVVQLRTEFKMGSTLPTRQINELSKIFANQKMQLAKYENEIATLRKQLKDYDHDQQIVSLKEAAGLVPIIGKGVRITLSDSEKKLGQYDDPLFYIVHSNDLELLINELWAAGAEAVAVNGYRIVTTSGISCAGTTILIDTKRLAPPYVVDAIGDPNNLKNALMMPGGFVETSILSYSLKFKIEKIDEETLIIPAYKGSISFEYAKPYEEEGQ